jgi:hypothetical protein
MFTVTLNIVRLLHIVPAYCESTDLYQRRMSLPRTVLVQYDSGETAGTNLPVARIAPPVPVPFSAYVHGTPPKNDSGIPSNKGEVARLGNFSNVKCNRHFQDTSAS